MKQKGPLEEGRIEQLRNVCGTKWTLHKHALTQLGSWERQIYATHVDGKIATAKRLFIRKAGDDLIAGIHKHYITAAMSWLFGDL